MKQIRSIMILNTKTDEMLEIGSIGTARELPNAHEKILEEKIEETLKKLPPHIKIIRQVKNVED